MATNSEGLLWLSACALAAISLGSAKPADNDVFSRLRAAVSLAPDDPEDHQTYLNLIKEFHESTLT